MGTWGPRPFENDDAADWLTELEDTDDERLLEEAFANVTDEAEGYLEAPECAIAIAAAEIVAALLERPHAALPDEAKAWAEGRPEPSEDLVAYAKRAVAAASGKTELTAMWEDSPDQEQWLELLEDLRSRLDE